MTRDETNPRQLYSIADSTKPSARKLTSVAALTLLVLSGAIVVLSRSGYSVARSRGVSMEPYLKDGDPLLMRKVSPASVQEGDIVLIYREGDPVLHRVIRKDTTSTGVMRLVTRGDNTRGPDAPVSADEVRGRLVLKLPLLGDGARLFGIRDGFLFGAIVAMGGLATALIARVAVRRGPTQ